MAPVFNGRQTFVLKQHGVLPDEQVVEVWWGGELVASIYGHRRPEYPNIRLVTKHTPVVQQSSGTTRIKREGAVCPRSHSPDSGHSNTKGGGG